MADVDSSLEHESSSQTGNNDEDFESNEDSPLESKVEMQMEEVVKEEVIVQIDDESIEDIVAGVCLIEVKPLLPYLGCKIMWHTRAFAAMLEELQS